MKKSYTNLHKGVVILMMAIFSLYSCDKTDEDPAVVEDIVYTIGDTLVSQFVDDATGEVLQEVVIEAVNIGTTQDTVGYWAVKYHSNLEETELHPHAYYDVVTIDELNDFMEAVETLYGSEAGEKLAFLSDEYSTSMQFIIGGSIESEMDINAYFDVLQTIDAYYMDESLPEDDVKNKQVDYFLDFLFYNGIDVDDLLLLLSDRGLTITDLMNEMGTSDFSTIGLIYYDYTDTNGIEGFNEFLDGLFGLTKSSSDKGGEDVLKIVGSLTEEILKNSAATTTIPTYSNPISLLYGKDTNPLNYIGTKEDRHHLYWASGRYYDHCNIKASCNYQLTTNLHDGLFLANAQITFMDQKVGLFHNLSAEINSTALNIGTYEQPIAQITTNITIKLQVKVAWFIGKTWSDHYVVRFTGDNGVTNFGVDW